MDVRLLYSLNLMSVTTARKRSLGQDNLFARVCHSVQGGRGVCIKVLGRTPLRTTGYGQQRAVRILLECILVFTRIMILCFRL